MTVAINQGLYRLRCRFRLRRLQKNEQSGRPDLNRRPLGPEPSALPTALRPVAPAREHIFHSLKEPTRSVAPFILLTKKPPQWTVNSHSRRRDFLPVTNLLFAPSRPPPSPHSECSFDYVKTATPKIPAAFLATGATGLEPAISGLTGQRDKPASLHPQNRFQNIGKNRKCQVLELLQITSCPKKSR